VPPDDLAEVCEDNIQCAIFLDSVSRVQQVWTSLIQRCSELDETLHSSIPLLNKTYLIMVFRASPTMDRARHSMKLSNKSRMTWIKQAVLSEKGAIVDFDRVDEFFRGRDFERPSLGGSNPISLVLFYSASSLIEEHVS